MNANQVSIPRAKAHLLGPDCLSQKWEPVVVHLSGVQVGVQGGKSRNGGRRPLWRPLKQLKS